MLTGLTSQAGEIEVLRDERAGDLQRALLLAAGAELYSAAGGRALGDRERRAARPGGEGQPNPAAQDRRAKGAPGPIGDS